MTGYTVHTGSSDKFASGWDRIFEDKPASKSSGKKDSKKASAKSKSKPVKPKAEKKSKGKKAKKK